VDVHVKGLELARNAGNEDLREQDLSKVGSRELYMEAAKIV
jgi:hypothetical protein